MLAQGGDLLEREVTARVFPFLATPIWAIPGQVPKGATGSTSISVQQAPTPSPLWWAWLRGLP